jgi:hypothetical protein
MINLYLQTPIHLGDANPSATAPTTPHPTSIGEVQRGQTSLSPWKGVFYGDGIVRDAPHFFCGEMKAT